MKRNLIVFTVLVIVFVALVTTIVISGNNSIYDDTILKMRPISVNKIVPEVTKSQYTLEEKKSEIDNPWAFYIINRENPLREDYTPELAPIDENSMVDVRILEYATEMLKAAQKDGIEFYIASAYRTPKKQQENFDEYINKMIKEGNSYDKAVEITASQIAKPYESEHNAGLALDLLTDDWWITHTDITDDFDETEHYKWLQNNSWKYGFIMRYPKGKESVTGYIYEPWHYRFIGLYHAKQMQGTDLTLEEYMKKVGG